MIKIQKPKMLKVLENYSLPALNEAELIEHVSMKNMDFVPTTQNYFEVDGCLLERVNFLNISELRTSFMDSKLKLCNFSNSSFTSESFIRSEFIESKFVGFNLTEELVRDVIFDHCDFTLANFSDIRFQNVLFKNCLFSDTRFFSCQFKDVEFLDSTLENIEIFKSPLKGVDISSCTLIGGKFCVEDLKGAIVSSEQALALSRLLGMIIRDEY